MRRVIFPVSVGALALLLCVAPACSDDSATGSPISAEAGNDADGGLAAWCAEPIETGIPGFVLRPPVLGRAAIPVVTDPAEAARRPERCRGSRIRTSCLTRRASSWEPTGCDVTWSRASPGLRSSSRRTLITIAPRTAPA